MTAMVATSIFVTLVQRNFWLEPFSLPAILRIEIVSILLGGLFAAIGLSIFSSANVKRIESMRADQGHEDPSQKLPILGDPLTIENTETGWQESLHVAFIAVFGSRLRILRLICLSFAVVAPVIVYALKSTRVDNSVSVITIALIVLVVASIGIAAAATTAIMIRVVLEKILAKSKARSRSTQLTQDSIQLYIGGQFKETVRWGSVSRVILTSRVFGLAVDDRILFMLPRAAISREIVEEIKHIVEVKSA